MEFKRFKEQNRAENNNLWTLIQNMNISKLSRRIQLGYHIERNPRNVDQSIWPQKLKYQTFQNTPKDTENQIHQYRI